MSGRLWIVFCVLVLVLWRMPAEGQVNKLLHTIGLVVTLTPLIVRLRSPLQRLLARLSQRQPDKESLEKEIHKLRDKLTRLEALPTRANDVNRDVANMMYAIRSIAINVFLLLLFVSLQLSNSIEYVHSRSNEPLTRAFAMGSFVIIWFYIALNLTLLVVDRALGMDRKRLEKRIAEIESRLQAQVRSAAANKMGAG